MDRSKSRYAAMFTLRSDGRYHGHWHDQNGVRHSIYDRDPEKLYWKIYTKENENAEPTFAQIAERWHDQNWDSIKGGTRSCYSAPYKRAVELFGDRIASEILPFEIENHLKQLAAKQYSAKTVKMQKTVYKLIYEAAIVDPDYSRSIKSNPAALAPIPRALPKPKQREAPEDEIVQQVRSRASTAYFGLFALFLMATGFRRGEALGVQWKDIDFDAGTIACGKSISHRTGTAVVSSTKTDAGIRSVPILPDLRRELVRPAEAKDDDYVFYGEDPSKPMPQATYSRRWMHYCKDMGFVTDEPEERISAQGKKYTVHNYKPTLTAHNFRHGYATLLFEAEVDEYTAQRLMGHSNIETTHAIYTHLRNKKKQSSIDKLIAHVTDEIGQ